jgi:hypothetical protein
MIVLL